MRPCIQLNIFLLLLWGTASARADGSDYLRLQRLANERGIEAAISAIDSEAADFATRYQRLQLELARSGPAELRRIAARVPDPALARLLAALDVNDLGSVRPNYAALEPAVSDASGVWLLLRARVELTLNRVATADSLLARLEATESDPYFRHHAAFLRSIQTFREGERERALREMQAAADAAEGDALAWEAAWMRVQLARILQELGNVQAARGEFDQAVILAERVGDQRIRAIALSWIAFQHERAGRFRECYELEREVAPLMLAQGDSMGALYGHLSWGWAANHVGQFEESMRLYAQAAELADRLDNAWGRAQSRLNLGWALLEGGEEERAAARFDEAAAIARAAGNVPQEADVLNGLASAQLRWGRPDLAAESYRRLAQMHQERGDERRELSMLANLALALRTMGDLDAAISLMEDVVNRSSAKGWPQGVSDINLAHWLYDVGRDAEAEAILDPILASRADGDLRRLTEAKLVRGNTLLHREQFADAAVALAEVDELFVRRGEERSRMLMLRRIARALWGSDDYDGARAKLAEAEALIRRLQPVTLANVLADRATVELLARDLDRAVELAREAARQLSLQGEQIEPLDAEARPVVYDQLINVAIAAAAQRQGGERGELIEESYVWLQRLKARSLLDCVRGSAQELRPQVEPTLAAEERDANRRLERCKRALDEPGIADDERERRRRELHRAQAEWSAVHARVLAEDERYRLASTLPLPSVDELRSAAIRDDGTVVLDFFLSRQAAGHPQRAALYLLHRDGIELYELPPARELDEKLDLVLGLLSEAAPGVDDGLLREALESAGRLLLEPARDRLLAASEVLVLPDGLLNSIPFAALRWQGSYLIERWPLQTAASLPVLAALRTRSPQRGEHKPALLVWESGTSADEAVPPAQRRGAPAELPLRFAPVERELLLTGYRDASWLGPDAPEQSELPAGLDQRADFAHAGILHFIAHGYFDELRPWRSALYLDPGRGEESRRLAARDVYRMELGADHATLSACETARVLGRRGRGLEGLAQSFFVAGCRSILASLWAVDDRSTALLMDGFYRGLAEGQPRAEALRAAQLELLASPGSRHPFYWAPFVLLGDGSQGLPLHRRSEGGLPPELALVALFVLALGWRLTRGFRRPRSA